MAAPVKPEPFKMREYTVLLRAVATTMNATDMLYISASLLTPGETQADKAVNRTVVSMVARLLDLPDNRPALVERVLRNLPEPEPTPNRKRAKR
jgi:hypothetical protein